MNDRRKAEEMFGVNRNSKHEKKRMEVASHVLVIESDQSSPEEKRKAAEHLFDKKNFDSENLLGVSGLFEKQLDIDVVRIAAKPTSHEAARLLAASTGVDEILDQLVGDPYPSVRAQVARVGRDKDLDVLVQDSDPLVLENVALAGRDKDLDVLVGNRFVGVRANVAKHGRRKDLDILVNDESPYVRAKVADAKIDDYKQQLLTDHDFTVRIRADIAYNSLLNNQRTSR